MAERKIWVCDRCGHTAMNVADVFSWKRVAIGREFPAHCDTPSVAYDLCTSCSEYFNVFMWNSGNKDGERHDD